MVGGDHVRRLSDGAAGQGRRGADRRVHLVLRRRAVRRHHDHAARAAGGELRAGVRTAGNLLGLFPRLLQLRRPEQGAAVQDRRRDDDRLCARRRRPRSDDRAIAADVRLLRTAQRLRFPDRGDRPVRHRRDPADDGRGPELPRQHREDQSEGGVADLERAAALLGDLAALLPDRLLDGHQPGGRDAGIVHELRHRQARLQARHNSSARARSKAWWRRRPRRMPPAPRRCCRCSRSACRARPPPPCCSAAC